MADIIPDFFPCFGFAFPGPTAQTLSLQNYSMPRLYSIVALLLILISVPLGIVLINIFNPSVLYLKVLFILGPLLFTVGYILYFINRKIADRYLSISEVTGGKVLKTKILSKPSLVFSIADNQCDLTYQLGSKYTPSLTILQAKVNQRTFLRLFRNDLILKGLKKLNLDWPDVKIGDKEFDEYFIVESRNTEFARNLFSGETLNNLKKIMKNIYEIRLEDGVLKFSLNEIYPSIDKYKHLIESFEASLYNLTIYTEG